MANKLLTLSWRPKVLNRLPLFCFSQQRSLLKETKVTARYVSFPKCVGTGKQVLLLCTPGSHRIFEGRGNMHVRGVVESSGSDEMGRSREHGVKPGPGVMQTRASMAALLERKEKKHGRHWI